MRGVKMLEAGMVEKKSVGSTALWMREAVEAIDKQFGSGYAREHPELVAVHAGTSHRSGGKLMCISLAN
jgi:hypothetical protein